MPTPPKSCLTTTMAKKSPTRRTQSVCPMRLQPVFMYQYQQAGMLPALEEALVLDCIECGTAQPMEAGRAPGGTWRPVMDWHSCFSAPWGERGRVVKEAGIVGMGGATFPTHVWMPPKKACAIGSPHSRFSWARFFQNAIILPFADVVQMVFPPVRAS